MGIFDQDLLTQAVLSTTPILLAAMGELISQRAGIINVGLEAYMLGGAFTGFWVALATGSVVLGIAAAVVGGAVLACVMAATTIEARADQVVVGIALIILAAGVTSYLYEVLYGDAVQRPKVEPMGPVAVPGLSDLPVVGRALFNQPAMVYIAYLLVPLVWVLLYRTRWGLGIRAVGDLPVAAQAGGLSVRGIRWFSAIAAGALGGLGGAFLSLVAVGTFIDGMSAGRGFLAVAAVIFGAWRPAWVAAGCFLFGGATAIELRLQGQPSVPQEVWFALAILIAALVVARLRAHRSTRSAYRLAVGDGSSKAPSRSAIGIGIGVALAIVCAVLGVTRPDVQLPDQLWLATPYVLTLAALAGVYSKIRAPRLLGERMSPM